MLTPLAFLFQTLRNKGKPQRYKISFPINETVLSIISLL